VDTFFSTISEISENFHVSQRLDRLSSGTMSRGVFLSDNQRRRSCLVLGLGYMVDVALFGLFLIRSILEKIANCELVHCLNARKDTSIFFGDSMSRYFAGYRYPE
jgi:hypothetical protein